MPDGVDGEEKLFGAELSMETPSEQPASSSEPKLPFEANGRRPKGEYKTWKTEKPAESFKERRAKRIAAHQAAVAAKNKLKEDGVRWVDAHKQFTTGEDAVVDDEEANTETTWEEIDYDTVREAVARQMLDNEAVLIDPATQGMSTTYHVRPTIVSNLILT